MTIPSSAYQITVDSSGNLGTYDIASGAEISYFTSVGNLVISGSMSASSYNLTAGTGIGISGLTISNTGIISASGGNGITVSGTNPLSIAMSGSYSGDLAITTSSYPPILINYTGGGGNGAIFEFNNDITLGTSASNAYAGSMLFNVGGTPMFEIPIQYDTNSSGDLSGGYFGFYSFPTNEYFMAFNPYTNAVFTASGNPATARNTLDDGSGNMSVAGNMSIAGSISFSNNSLNIITAGTSSSSGQAGIRFNPNNDIFMFPQANYYTGFVNNAQNTWFLQVQDPSGKVITKNNTLDDGQGDMLVTGYLSIPSQTSSNNGKIQIFSTNNNFGQFQIANPSENGEASMSFSNYVSSLGTGEPTINSGGIIWDIGLSNWGSGTFFGIGNSSVGGKVITIQPNGSTALTGAMSVAGGLTVAGGIGFESIYTVQSQGGQGYSYPTSVTVKTNGSGGFYGMFMTVDADSNAGSWNYPSALLTTVSSGGIYGRLWFVFAMGAANNSNISITYSGYASSDATISYIGSSY